ncbi:hypothetical protein GCM10009691_30540 [Brevibacterium picturae]|uniref:Uncharacterized protein n=1 Tax=Brevibacterium picturae TaxID=260553 RepID=A0ABP4N4B2_9MICO
MPEVSYRNRHVAVVVADPLLHHMPNPRNIPDIEVSIVPTNATYGAGERVQRMDGRSGSVWQSDWLEDPM